MPELSKNLMSERSQPSVWDRPSPVLQQYDRERWMTAAWLKAYLRGLEGTTLLPTDPDARRILLDTLVLERGIYELGHALQHRPERTEMALDGLLELLAGSADPDRAPQSAAGEVV